MCQRCGHQCTVTAGTIFDKTRTPFRVWLAAGWYLTSQKQGVSALGLQRVLGLGSYQTAWTLLHQYRHAIVRAGRDALHGLVEVDETYLAITDRERPAPKGKSPTCKVLVALAVEILEPRGFGRIRLQRLPNDTESALVPCVQESIAPAGARAPTVPPRTARSADWATGTRVRYTSTPTSTSSCSASTGAPSHRAGCCSIACCSRHSPLAR
jgi:hypothetical protein